MIMNGINYTGVSVEVFTTVQMVKASQELITDEYLSNSIADIILKSGLTSEENEQVFNLTSISQDQRTEILEKVEFMKNESGEFDIYHMSFLFERKFVKTVNDKEIASDICSKSNRTLTPEQSRLGADYTFYRKRDKVVLS